MLYQRDPNRSPSPPTKVLACLALVACAVAVSADAEGTCPDNFQCRPRIEVLLAQGVEQSASLRSLVETLGSHPGVELNLDFARQRAGKRAQSALSVQVIYPVENGEVRRKVFGVTGDVTIPYVAYGHDQIALIAHELEHVREALNGTTAADAVATEARVVDFEEQVRAELEASRAAQLESR